MATTTEIPASIGPRKIQLLGVPLDLGQSRRGVDMGPSAMRVAGLEARLEALGHIVEDGGNVSVAMPELKKEGDPSAKYLKEITATCTKSAELVAKALEAGKIPLVLGGDHSVAAGTVSGVAEFYRRDHKTIGLNYLHGTFANDERLVAAGTIIAVAPLIALFACLQRYFFRGVGEGAVKG